MIKKVCGISIIGIALVGCSDKTSSQAAAPAIPPVPVSMAEITVRDVPLYFEEMGIITPQQIAEVKPQVSGMLVGLHFKEGEWVEKGELLYSIEEAPYTIRVQEAEAQLAQNIANLHNAEKKLARYKSLSKQDLIAQVEWDELETQVALGLAMVKADEARLAAAELDLKHCSILAPISGRTGKSALHVGNMAENGSPLLTLSQDKTLYVDFAFTERELQQLPNAIPHIEVFGAGTEECLAAGEVTFIGHTIDQKSGMLDVRAQLTTMHKHLFSGQSVRVHLLFGEKSGAQMIPLKAIKTNQTGSYVFSVKEDNTVEMRTIQLGPEEKGLIVVETGLEGATKVVTEGQLRLFSGSKVEAVQQ